MNTEFLKRLLLHQLAESMAALLTTKNRQYHFGQAMLSIRALSVMYDYPDWASRVISEASRRVCA